MGWKLGISLKPQEEREWSGKFRWEATAKINTKSACELQLHISAFGPIYPLALAHFPYPLFHTYAWALLCTQFVQIGFGLAVECLASEKKWPPSAFPALLPGIPSIRPHTHTYHTHTEIRARMLIQSQTINLRAGRILKRLIQYGRRFTIQTLANARSESVRSPRVRISVRPAVYPSVFV